MNDLEHILESIDVHPHSIGCDTLMQPEFYGASLAYAALFNEEDENDGY